MQTSNIEPGFAVYAHRLEHGHLTEAGQYVGTVVDIIEHHGLHYVHVRGGLDLPNDLYLPIAAVRSVVGKQVHLNLSVADLAGQAWHLPPHD